MIAREKMKKSRYSKEGENTDFAKEERYGKRRII